MSNKAEKRGLVPKLRFPEFREAGEWEKMKIGKALIEQPRPIDMEEEGEYSLVTVKRRYGGVVSRGIFKGKSIKVKTQFLLKENDFLISKRQIVHCACGVVPKYLEGSIVSNEYSVLRARDGFDVSFFDYFAQQPKVSQSFLRCSIGIVIEKMLFKLNDWLKQEFLLPSLPEQQKIADCLTSLDDLITLEAQKLDTLKTHKKGLMQQLFPAEGETLPKLRFPEFWDAGEWEEKSVGDFGEVVTGSTPSTVRREFYGGGIPFVSPADISDLRFVNETKTTLTALGFGETRPIKASSVLFVCIGSTIGKVTQNVRDCATNQQINSVIPNTEHSGGFVYYLLSLNAGRIANLAGKQAVPIINKTQFSSVRLLVPKLGEQECIADCLASLDDLITAQSQKLAAFKTHKKGLMQQLFPVLDEVQG